MIALITDTHFGVKSDAPIFFDYFDKFLTNSFFPELKRRKIKKIIHLGDVFDRRKFINFNTLTWARKSFFDKIAAAGMDLDIIVGNHDTYYKNTNDINSPGLLLSDYENIRIFEDFHTEGNLVYVPWITEETKSATLKKISESPGNILLGHLEITGYTMFRGAVCDKGLSSDIFDGYDLVLSGHFHTKNNKKNIYYLGCPWDLMFNDAEEIKGFHILDEKKASFEFIQNPYKLFNRLEYDDTNAKAVEDVLYSDKKYEELKNGFVKVIVKAKTNPIFFDRYAQRMSEANPHDVDYANEVFEVDEETQSNISISEDTLTLVKKSIDDYSDLISDEDKKAELESLLSELYIEAIKL